MLGRILTRRLVRISTKFHHSFREGSSLVDAPSDTRLISISNSNLIASNQKCLEELESGLILINDFIDEKEEESLFNELDPYLRKLRWILHDA